METDSKNRRGRPRSIAGEMARIYQSDVILDSCLRAASNYYYAFHLIHALYGRPENGSFFISENGKLRRQGIAEQIGRMFEYELITEQEARELVESCKAEYEAGATVKEIESYLKTIRLNITNAQKGGKDENNCDS